MKRVGWMIGLILAAGLIVAGLALAQGTGAPAKTQPAPAATKGRIKQSVCQWCFTKAMDLDTLARNVAAMGVKSIELVNPKDWPILQKHGLTPPTKLRHFGPEEDAAVKAVATEIARAVDEILEEE